MINPASKAVQLLREQEEDLCRRLLQIRKALAVLDQGSSNNRSAQPRCRAELLRDYLLAHPAGVRLKDVPVTLKDAGFVSAAGVQAPNWIYQQKPERDYFCIVDGLVTIRPDYATAFPDEPQQRIVNPGAPNEASTTGVNSTSIQHSENDLRG